MLTASLGASFFGRPIFARRMRRSSSRISARSNQPRSSGGASSGSTHLLAVVRFFVGMPVPHGDDAPSIVACRPNQHDETIAEPTRRDEAPLAVIPSLVG